MGKEIWEKHCGKSAATLKMDALIRLLVPITNAGGKVNAFQWIVSPFPVNVSHSFCKVICSKQHGSARLEVLLFHFFRCIYVDSLFVCFVALFRSLYVSLPLYVIVECIWKSQCRALHAKLHFIFLNANASLFFVRLQFGGYVIACESIVQS